MLCFRDLFNLWFLSTRLGCTHCPIGWPRCGNKYKSGTKNSTQILQQFLYLRGATYLPASEYIQTSQNT